MNLTYAAIMTAALATGFLLSRRTQQVLPLGRWERLGIGLGGFCGATSAVEKSETGVAAHERDLPRVWCNPDGKRDSLLDL